MQTSLKTIHLQKISSILAAKIIKSFNLKLSIELFFMQFFSQVF